MTTPKCGANKTGGGVCAQPAGAGTDHLGFGRCKFHGGSTPAHRKSAKLEQAAAAVAQYGLPREIGPHAALLEELHRTAGHVAWLQTQLTQEEAALIQESGGGQGSVTELKASVWLSMYQSERKHFSEVAATCVKAGVEERRVRIAERTGQLFADAIRGILSDLGVDTGTPETAQVVRRHLVGLQGGQAA